MLSFSTSAVFQDEILKNWEALDRQVDDALYEVFLPPQAWLWAGTGMTHVSNNDRGDYLGFHATNTDNEAWTNIHVLPTWKTGSLGFEFLYTNSTANVNTVDVELLANVVGIGESVDAGTDVQHTFNLPPPSTALFLKAYSDPAIRLPVNAGQHRLVTLRLKRIPSDNTATWRFEGLIVRFGTGKREVHL